MNDSAALRFLKNIWPKIYRIINIVVYRIFMIIRNGVISAIDQIKNL